MRQSASKKRRRYSFKPNNEQYRLLAANVKDYIILMLDPKGFIISWNKGVEHLLGYKKDEIIGKNFSILFTTEDQLIGKHIKELNDALLKGRVQDNNMVVKKDGSLFWSSGITTSLYDKNNKLRGFSKIAQNITDRWRIEHALKDSDMRYSLVIEQFPLSIQVVSPDGYTIQVNRAWEKLWRTTLEKIKNYNILKDKQLEEKGVMSYIKKAFSGQPISTPAIKYEPSKTIKNITTVPYRWIKSVLYPIRDNNRKLREVILIQEDITKEKLYEERLKKSELKFRRIFESNVIGSMFWTMDGTVTQANDEFLRIIGYTQDEVRKKRINLHAITPAQYKHLDKAAIHQLIERGISDPFEKEFVSKDGTRIPVLMGMALLEQSHNKGVAFVLDIRERKQLEKRKDEFISIASHELKTPLTTIKAFTQLLKREFGEIGSPMAMHYLQKMDVQLERLTNLVYNLLDVSKIASGKMELNEEVFDFDTLVKEIAEDTKETTKTSRIIVKGQTQKRVFADKFRIGQVITNILSNAIKYSSSPQKILIYLSSDDNKVTTAVQDFGIGIPKVSLEKIFERFYRVKDKKRENFPGMGLGLYISHQLIKRHGGKMWVKSTEGKGSTFYFTLPITLHKKIVDETTRI